VIDVFSFILPIYYARRIHAITVAPARSIGACTKILFALESHRQMVDRELTRAHPGVDIFYL
jgi:hypothetical protein